MVKVEYGVAGSQILVLDLFLVSGILVPDRKWSNKLLALFSFILSIIDEDILHYYPLSKTQ